MSRAFQRKLPLFGLTFASRPLYRTTPYLRSYALAASSTGGGPTSTQGSSSGQTIGVDTSSSGKQGRDLVSNREGGRKMRRRQSSDWTSGDPIERVMNDFFSVVPFFGGGLSNPFFDINRFFTTPSSVSGSNKFDWTPKIDVKETDNAFIMHAELPGMKKDDIKISLKDNVLTLSGERKFEDKKEDGEFKRVERSYGAFMRALTIPEGVDPKMIKAKYDNGILEVEIPKPKEQKTEKEETISIS